MSDNGICWSCKRPKETKHISACNECWSAFTWGGNRALRKIRKEVKAQGEVGA